jgi:pilus assembly protein CpaB
LTRRLLTIVLAIVLAVVATGAVLLYVKGADQRYLNNHKAVSVLVASQQVPAGIQAGTALTEGMFRREKLPAFSVPSDAVRTITPDQRNLVLSGDLPSGQLLLQPMLVTALAAHTGLAIPSGMVALSLQFCLARDVAGFVQAGSQVAVFNTFVSGPAGSATQSCNGINTQKGVTGVHVRLVLPNVKVLAVGAAASTTGTTGATATSTSFSQSSSTNQASNTTIMLVTVAVNQLDAEKLIHLDEVQVPYLALVTSSSNVKADIKFQP